MGDRLEALVLLSLVSIDIGGQTLALSGRELLLLRLSVALFIAMVAFCVVIVIRVNETTKVANTANRLATSLDRRTAALENKLTPKE